MNKKRFFEIDYDEIYYIIDSSRLQRKETAFEDEEEYQRYCLENSLMGVEVVGLLNSLSEENKQLRKENEEYEEEAEDMQTKINMLYNEAKKHMSGTEWKKFNRRIIERDEELGIKWVRL